MNEAYHGLCLLSLKPSSRSFIIVRDSLSACCQIFNNNLDWLAVCNTRTLNFEKKLHLKFSRQVNLRKYQLSLETQLVWKRKEKDLLVQLINVPLKCTQYKDLRSKLERIKWLYYNGITDGKLTENW